MRKSLCFLTIAIFLFMLALPCAASPENLCEGATIYACSGYINDDEQAAYLIDGDLDTKWCSTEGSTTDYSLSDKCRHYIIIDLGSEVTFNTYRLFGAGEHGRDAGNDYMNPLDWEIDVSSDAEKWTEVSYIYGNALCDVQVHLGSDVSARYVRLLVIEPTQSAENIVRLYEFQLTNADPSEANLKNDLSVNLIGADRNSGGDSAVTEPADTETDTEDAADDSDSGDDAAKADGGSIVPVIVVIIAAAVAMGATAGIVFTRKK